INFHRFTVLTAVSSKIFLPLVLLTTTLRGLPFGATFTLNNTEPSQPRSRARSGYSGAGLLKYPAYPLACITGCCTGSTLAVSTTSCTTEASATGVFSIEDAFFNSGSFSVLTGCGLGGATTFFNTGGKGLSVIGGIFGCITLGSMILGGSSF